MICRILLTRVQQDVSTLFVTGTGVRSPANKVFKETWRCFVFMGGPQIRLVCAREQRACGSFSWMALIISVGAQATHHFGSFRRTAAAREHIVLFAPRDHYPCLTCQNNIAVSRSGSDRWAQQQTEDAYNVSAGHCFEDKLLAPCRVPADDIKLSLSSCKT